ncbi:hypothetical protein ACWEN3_16745 [Streptomyces sp. NPDC004561]
MPSLRRTTPTGAQRQELVEALADNALPEAGALYAALDMPFAVLVGQISAAYRA